MNIHLPLNDLFVFRTWTCGVIWLYGFTSFSTWVIDVWKGWIWDLNIFVFENEKYKLNRPVLEITMYVRVISSSNLYKYSNFHLHPKNTTIEFSLCKKIPTNSALEARHHFKWKNSKNKPPSPRRSNKKMTNSR